MARSGEPRMFHFLKALKGSCLGAEAQGEAMGLEGSRGNTQGVKQGYLNPVMQQNYGIDGPCVAHRIHVWYIYGNMDPINIPPLC